MAIRESHIRKDEDHMRIEEIDKNRIERIYIKLPDPQIANEED